MINNIKNELLEIKLAEPDRLNVYICKKNHKTVTIDKHVGVTPYMMNCKQENCTEMSSSSCYDVPKFLFPTYEWYKPKSLKNLSKWEKQHVEKGGLSLRKI